MLEKPQRLFFAIELSEEIKNHLSLFIQSLQQHPAGKHFEFYTPEKLHLTLRFLGPTLPQQMQACLQELPALLTSTTALRLQLGQRMIGFPPQHPRMIAILCPLTVELAELYNLTEGVAVKAGFAPSLRPFLPHITLARVPQWHAQTMNALIADSPSLDVPSQAVNHIALFRSDQEQGSSVYTVIKRLFFL